MKASGHADNWTKEAENEEEGEMGKTCLKWRNNKDRNEESNRDGDIRWRFEGDRLKS